MLITIVSSSTRTGRVSHRIALAIQREIEALGHQAALIDLVELALPPFSERYHLVQDRPANWPPTMATLRASDGIILVTPEYNGNMSPGLVNFVSVFAKQGFEGKPIGVATGSTGGRGGSRAASLVQQMILSLRAFPHPRTLQVGEMHLKLDATGALQDEDFGSELSKYVTGFLAFCQALADASP